MPTLTIDGKKIHAPEGATILQAARSAGIEIPTLCHHEGLEPWGGCRLCVVDVTKPSWDGWCKMVVSCMYEAEEGIVVMTDTNRVKETRKVVLDLLLARCPDTPLIRKLAKEHGFEKTSYVRNPEPTDCILCGLCTRVCDHIGVSAISAVSRGAGREIAPPFNEAPPDCIGCLACAEVCPTHCIPYETSNTGRKIWNKEFEMVRCTVCGRAHITVDQAKYYGGKNDIPEEYYQTCDACKRRHHAKVFTKLSQVG